MKYLITERQYNSIKEQEEEVLSFPFAFFNDDWNLVLSVMKGRPFKIEGNLILKTRKIKTLGNLKSVGGNLSLYSTIVKTLGNLESVGGYLNLYSTPIKSLGDLKSVGEWLVLSYTPIKTLDNLERVGSDLIAVHSDIESFGNLKSVGGSLDLNFTPLSKRYSKSQIKKMIDVKGDIK